MNHKLSCLGLFMGMLTMSASIGLAQAASKDCNVMAEPAKVVELTGRIESIEENTICDNSEATQTLVLTDMNSPGAPTRVLLAPDKFLHRKKMNFALGGDVMLSGYATEVDGKNFFVAMKVSSRDRSLTLRDSNGNPLWVEKGKSNLSVGR